jgi:predicted PhzF superfamily epimerase YddE/YHI9
MPGSVFIVDTFTSVPFRGNPAADPVTGSVHSVLAGFWKAKLGKEMLTAYQASLRGGEIFVKSFEERVELGGKSVIVLRGDWDNKIV